MAYASKLKLDGIRQVAVNEYASTFLTIFSVIVVLTLDLILLKIA